MNFRALSFTLLFSASFFTQPLLAQKKEKKPFPTPYEQGNGNQTTTYAQCLSYYQNLAANFKEITLEEAGPTDSGLPLHVVVISADGSAKPEPELTRNKRVLLIQNGIHPGEPEGIDASMMLARNLVTDKKLKPVLDRVTVVIIPVYNVGGALNRNTHSRANQNGPESYGFRGNAKNLDLNRDYIKLDSKNAQTFVQLFRKWQPDVFVDTHTSNGADYQHVMTLVSNQPDKLHPTLAQYQKQHLLPALYAGMEKQKFPLTPYVDPLKGDPELGIGGFLDIPRYSTGYAALFNTIGFMTEAHMLKPFPQRVKATYAFLDILLQHMHQNHAQLATARKQAIEQTIAQKTFPINYQHDTAAFDLITFRGYKGAYKKSEVSGQERLYYDRKKTYSKQVKYFNKYTSKTEIKAPAAYLIPQAWTEVIERLQLNGVQLRRLAQDTELTLPQQYIDTYETARQPYEGHYLHHSVKTRQEPGKITFRKGDYVVLLNQPANKFVVEALEPEAVDSYFNWNFFDSILQQKEWFSDYVFEDIAADMLKQNPTLEQQLEQKKATDPEFAKNAWQQLYWLYQKSDHFEKSVRRYPVARVQNLGELRLE